MPIGEKLKEFGKKKFGNITKFAKALGMQPSNLYDYINNKSKPGSEFLIKLKEMGCDLNWLLTDKDKGQAIIKEPSVDYKIKELEEENKRLEEENERLRKSIENTIHNLIKESKIKKKK